MLIDTERIILALHEDYIDFCAYNNDLGAMIFEVGCVSILAGAGIGYCYGIFFGKRMQTYRQALGTKKAPLITIIAMNFMLNYVLLAATLVLLMRYLAVDALLLLGSILAAFFIKVYQLSRKTL